MHAKCDPDTIIAILHLLLTEEVVVSLAPDSVLIMLKEPLLEEEDPSSSV